METIPSRETRRGPRWAAIPKRSVWEEAVQSLKTQSWLLAGVAACALGLAAPAAKADDITIGFVTHAQGNPFVEQIVDGAKAAAKDLGVTLKVQESPGGSPEGQLDRQLQSLAATLCRQSRRHRHDRPLRA